MGNYQLVFEWPRKRLPLRYRREWDLVRVRAREEKLLETLVKIFHESEENLEISIVKGKRNVGEARIKGGSIMVAFYGHSPYIPESVTIYLPAEKDISATTELPFVREGTVEGLRESRDGKKLEVAFRAEVRGAELESKFKGEKPEIRLRFTELCHGEWEELCLHEVEIRGRKEKVTIQMKEHRL
ncbi:hypothetical protein A3L04_08785 [Thermococcus chitonophagus]|uniref:Uncharacterized protein n=1 Tax=Thermococcus chitonophagus TaxID=54262 RepID=A0A160VS09_9EURY|nr:hypothetical protein [Thermococcus chitonophagus]ASJ17158.1 hypothetical protein A3L04_08785 [Thermococcus chitonophagus]CUX77767.1 hypothetical protein CHITON_0988 [Thermococcus chitonophagus]